MLTCPEVQNNDAIRIYHRVNEISCGKLSPYFTKVKF